MYFEHSKTHFENILLNEKLTIKQDNLDDLLKLLSKMTTYEEEEVKIRPHFYITENIQAVLKLAPHKIYQEMIRITYDNLKFNKIIKSLIPLCNKGWIIVIEFQESAVNFSILKYIAKHKSEEQEKILLDLKDNISEFKLLSVECINSHQIKLHGIESGINYIDFYLYEIENLNKYKLIDEIISDIPKFNELNETVSVVRNFMSIAFDNVHGCIILIVDETSKKVEKISKDFIRLTKPISIMKYAENALQSLQDSNSIEEYYAINGLFMNLLNIDGITVVNTKGEIIGYNLFYIKNSYGGTIIGGARKRAAYNLAYSRHEHIVGVYFQSQDGHAEYLKGARDVE